MVFFISVQFREDQEIIQHFRNHITPLKLKTVNENNNWSLVGVTINQRYEEFVAFVKVSGPRLCTRTRNVLCFLE